MHYVVRAGDTLTGIAQRQLGDARLWPRIAAINHLRSPDRLWGGQVSELQLICGLSGTPSEIRYSPALAGRFHEDPALVPSVLFTRVLQGVQIVGFALTAINLTAAAEKSAKTKSILPFAAESLRQAGGWAGAWAGVKLGATAGALAGLETGPGALITGAVGAIALGTLGYFGFDWVADHMDRN